MEPILLKTRAEAKKQHAFQKTLIKTCWQRIYEILQAKHIHPNSFYERTLLDERYYYNAKNNSPSPPDTRTIVAISAGLDLGVSLTFELLSLAGHTFNPTSDEHNAYYFVISHMPGYTIDEKNLLLESEGIKPLGTRSKK